MHFGVVFSNDKFRFQLFVNHKDNRIPGLMSIAKSKIYSLDINTDNFAINNDNSLSEFLNHLSLFQNISDEELYYHFTEFEKLHNESKKESIGYMNKLKNIKNKISERFSTPPEKELTDFERKMEEIEYKMLKQKYE